MPGYPIADYRLAPVGLSEILQVPIPTGLIRKNQDNLAILANLDESPWRIFDQQTCRALANLVLLQVGRRIRELPSVIRTRNLPNLPNVRDLAALPITPRALHCLQRLRSQGRFRSPAELGRLTIGDLVETSGCGVRTLLELLSYFESFTNSQSSGEKGAATPSEPTIRQAKRLAEMKESRLVRSDDPRLGHLVRAIDAGARDARDAAARILNTHSDSTSAIAVEHIQDLRRQIKKLSMLTLDKELLDLSGTGRKAQILARYLGLDGLGGATLQSVGTEFSLTRERVRQIVTKASERLGTTRPFAPALDRTIAFIVDHVPTRVAEIESKLQAEGLTAGVFRIEGVLNAAELFGRQLLLSITRSSDEKIIHAQHIQSVDTIIRVARRVIEHWGVSTIADVAAEIHDIEPGLSDSNLIASILANQQNFIWLDQSAGWFYFSDVVRNRVRNRIEKILSVANPIGASEMRTGIGRDYHMQGFSPPTRVLLELCRHLPDLHVNETTIAAAQRLKPEEVLSPTESGFVRVLSRHNGIMARVDLESACLLEGMNRSTFYRYLSHSPVISKYAVGVYGLIGSNVQPGVIESMAPRTSRGRVLEDYGWTRNGKIWVAYHLSEATLLTGVVGVPAGIKSFIEGEFRLKAADGTRIGTLVARQASAWGLGPFFNRRGGEAGDFLLICFDLKEREASLSLGTIDLVDEYRDE